MSDPGILSAVLREAAKVILAVESGRVSLDDALDRTDPRCRRILEHLLLNFFRFRRALRAQWRRFCVREPAPEISALLDAASAQIRFQNAVPPQSAVNVAVTLAKPRHADKFVNAVLRRVMAEPWRPPQTAREILPPPILTRWRQNFPDAEVERLAALFLRPAPFTFRLCRDVPPPAGAEILPVPGPFRFASGSAAAVLDSPEFSSGAYYVQDPAAALAVSLAVPELPRCRLVLDLCAAPGGKSLMLAELLPPEAELTAADRSARRQRRTEENFRRHHVAARIVTADPGELAGTFDLVLADVPCSNTGVFRRRPDALWRFSEPALAEVMRLQHDIIRQAARLVAPGGVLIAASCSIERDENAALTAVPGFRVAAEKTLLPAPEHDGAFAAKLVRQ